MAYLKLLGNRPLKLKLKYILLAIFCFLAILPFIANAIIENNAENKTFDLTQNIPKNKVGLVLGTSKYLKNGHINLYFKYRIEACLKLFQSKKIDFILVSGDNGRDAYDEPSDFKAELIHLGIPAKKIFLDYAGFRTLDSVVRSKAIFGQDKITIISQKFHNERAIYLAEKNGISAVAYNAPDVTGKYGLKVRIREYLARVKVFIDLLFNIGPKFLGDKIIIQ